MAGQLHWESDLAQGAGNRLTCPYNDLPDESFWSRGVAAVEPSLIDIFSNPKFQISRADKIATAGSCFAQHIARYLSSSGYTYFVAERGPEFLNAFFPGITKKLNFDLFSARFGNIYTTRQLVQLFDRAFGAFAPLDNAWVQNGRFYDPWRPHVEYGGFGSVEELELERREHLAAVRWMFESLDVFVFTLGLTEAYTHRGDGAAYPVCPGCGLGRFDPKQHAFLNLRYNDIIDDLSRFRAGLLKVNPKARIILTVSPVPLVATAEGRHVVQSTLYSKSVLRAAAGAFADEHSDTQYFPSYDLIAGHQSRAAYFEADLRNVREEGVGHVMRMFFRHFTNDAPARSDRSSAKKIDSGPQWLPNDGTAVICEELMLDVRSSQVK